MTSDLDLLRRFARENSQDAFAEIVRRHLNLVYSAALRQVRSPQLAEDVAQSVFADLARNAGALARGGDASSPTTLTPWLYAVTRRTAIDAIRKESRRQLREQIAVEMTNMNATFADWTQIEPLLDDAMAALDETDRIAILLRYFENKNLREVGEALGASEDAAQKRVSRAVEQLREFFSKRKVTIGASGLAVLISANAVQSAPVGLAAAILSVALGTTQTIGMTMIHKILITGMTAAVVGTSIYALHLRSQIGSLQQEQTLLGQQIEQLSRDRDEATNQLAALQQENGQLHVNETELLRLRGEVGRLRGRQNVLPETSPLKTNAPPRSDAVSVLVGTKIALFPDEDVQALGLAWTTDMDGNRISLLTDPQYKTITEAMQGPSDVKVVSAPRVVTINGEHATFSVTRAHALFSYDGTNEMPIVNYTNLGTVLNVRPDYSTNTSTFNLSYGAKMNVLSGDPSQPDIQTIEATNQMDMSPGQTVVMEMKVPSGAWMPDETNSPAGERSLLFFVTPTVVNGRDFQKRQ